MPHRWHLFMGIVMSNRVLGMFLPFVPPLNVPWGTFAA